MAFEGNSDHVVGQLYSEGDPFHLVRGYLAIQQWHYLCLQMSCQIILGLTTTTRNFGTEVDANCRSLKTGALNAMIHLGHLILEQGILHPALTNMDMNWWVRTSGVQAPSSSQASKCCFHYLLPMGPDCQNYFQQNLGNLIAFNINVVKPRSNELKITGNINKRNGNKLQYI
jgi:hypothetical protein